MATDNVMVLDVGDFRSFFVQLRKGQQAQLLGGFNTIEGLKKDSSFHINLRNAGQFLGCFWGAF